MQKIQVSRCQVSQLISTNNLECSYNTQKDIIIMKIKSKHKQIFLKVQSAIKALNVSVYNYDKKNADYTQILDLKSIKTFQNLFNLKSLKMLEYQLKYYLNNNFMNIGNKLRVLNKIQIIQSSNNYQQLKLRSNENIKLLR